MVKCRGSASGTRPDTRRITMDAPAGLAMEIQGEEEQIYRVIRSLTQGRWIRIEKMDVKIIPLVEKEHGFKAG